MNCLSQVTGEKALYLSPTSAWSVVGFYPSESANLLDFLHRHVQSLDFTCRIKWEPRTVVVWDQASSCSVLSINRLLVLTSVSFGLRSQRATAHSAVPDYSSNSRRHLVRMLPLGSRPSSSWPSENKVRASS